jgi:hypothetical protein
MVGGLRSAGVIHKVDDSLLIAISREVGVAHRLEREPFGWSIFFTIHHEAGSFLEVLAVD